LLLFDIVTLVKASHLAYKKPMPHIHPQRFHSMTSGVRKEEAAANPASPVK